MLFVVDSSPLLLCTLGGITTDEDGTSSSGSAIKSSDPKPPGGLNAKTLLVLGRLVVRVIREERIPGLGQKSFEIKREKRRQKIVQLSLTLDGVLLKDSKNEGMALVCQLLSTLLI